MKIFVIGSGGREHALGWALSRSAHHPELFFAPGNPGTQILGTSVPVNPMDVGAVVAAAGEIGADLTVVGPEAPLAAGLVDALARVGLDAVGPTRGAAMIETSKVFAKQVMRSAGIPTASWRTFDDPGKAAAFVRAAAGPLVVKADGLAAGKGVVVCRSADEAEAAVTAMMVDEVFGAAGRRVLIEERLTGPELSALALTDGKHVRMLPPARDHKSLLDGDEGPNTGGMGAVAPVPVDAPTLAAIELMLRRAVDEMARRAVPFRGILYAGLMLTDDGPKVLEFNCRLGDPEAQVILPLLASDLVDALAAVVDGSVDRLDLRWRDETAVGVVVATGAYPGRAETGLVIEGHDTLPEDVLLFHSGTRREGGRLLAAGGRVFTVVARSASVDEARERALAAAEQIRFPGRQFRRDIGLRPGAREWADSRDSTSQTDPGGRARPRFPEPVSGGAPDAGEAPLPRIGIVVGSDSDLSVAEEAAAVLRRFDVPYEMTIASAHRAPDRARRIAQEAEGRGWRVIIAGAGGAAHLAGAIAGHTVLPVVGVPLDATPLRGMDALLATVQMPPGVPVATMAIGKWGMHNAALLAVQILATADERLRGRLHEEKERLARAVEEKAAALEANAATVEAKSAAAEPKPAALEGAS